MQISKFSGFVRRFKQIHFFADAIVFFNLLKSNGCLLASFDYFFYHVKGFRGSSKAIELSIHCLTTRNEMPRIKSTKMFLLLVSIKMKMVL